MSFRGCVSNFGSSLTNFINQQAASWVTTAKFHLHHLKLSIDNDSVNMCGGIISLCCFDGFVSSYRSVDAEKHCIQFKWSLWNLKKKRVLSPESPFSQSFKHRYPLKGQRLLGCTKKEMCPQSRHNLLHTVHKGGFLLGRMMTADGVMLYFLEEKYTFVSFTQSKAINQSRCSLHYRIKCCNLPFSLYLPSLNPPPLPSLSRFHHHRRRLSVVCLLMQRREGGEKVFFKGF